MHNGLTLNKEEVAKLDNLIANIPTKFGMPFVNLLNSAEARNKLEAEAAKDQEASGKQLTLEVS